MDKPLIPFEKVTKEKFDELFPAFPTGMIKEYYCQHQWISTKDRLPNLLQEVIYVLNMYNVTGHIIKKDVVCGHRDEKGWYICFLYTSYPLTNDKLKVEVTHWMEIPQLPKDEQIEISL